MSRKITAVLAIALLLVPLSAAADTGRSQAPSTPSSSTTKRVVWTIVGAGAGFAAGAFLGLNEFDDAINSDRKVWTTAIVGAAAGGVAGALLSRSIGRNPHPATAPPRPRGDTLGITWESAVAKAPLR